MRLSELINYTDQLLAIAGFRDYCPNGLQVEGRSEVRRLVTGVTASLDLINAAASFKADAILVHHGYFWKGEDPRIAGMKRQRVSALLRHEMSLLAYHLPLDAHAELGNNAQLAQHLGLRVDGRFGEQDVALHGEIVGGCTLAQFGILVKKRLGRSPLVVGDSQRVLRRIAWCTGAAQSLIESAVALGVDAYLTGEASEQTVHVARETGIAFIAAGHHATERYGIQALGSHLAARFGIEHRFVDLSNPV